MRHLRVLFDLRDAQLFLYGEGVEEIAAEDERVLRGVDSVDPAGRDEESVAGFYNDAAALLHFVAEEDVRLAAGQRPLFIFLKQKVSREMFMSGHRYRYRDYGTRDPLLFSVAQGKF